MPAECLRVATVVQSYSVQAVVRRMHLVLAKLLTLLEQVH